MSTRLDNSIKRILRPIIWTAKRKTPSQILESKSRKMGMQEYAHFTPTNGDEVCDIRWFIADAREKSTVHKIHHPDVIFNPGRLISVSPG